jgi:acetyl-CoA C-acetyltransferase
MREAAIVATARTGIGKAYRGYFNATEAPRLAGFAMTAAVTRAGIDPARIDDVFWGVGSQWGNRVATPGGWRCSPPACRSRCRPSRSTASAARA